MGITQTTSIVKCSDSRRYIKEKFKLRLRLISVITDEIKSALKKMKNDIRKIPEKIWKKLTEGKMAIAYSNGKFPQKAVSRITIYPNRKNKIK